MPSRRKKLTGKAIDRRLALGFGRGEGADYRPYLRNIDVPSRGTSSVIRGWKHGRNHHLLSRLERNYFFCLEWSDDVLDIREQFPLEPLERTLQIADELGIRHPKARDGFPMMTLDFMLTVRTAKGIVQFARTVKYEEDLKNRRTLQKFEIERRYFEDQSISWGIVTEKDVPEVLWRNIEWIHDCREAWKLRPITPDQISSATTYLICRLKTPIPSMAAICLEGDAELQFTSGTCLKVLRHLIANKMILVDMNTRLRPDVPVRLWTTLK